MAIPTQAPAESFARLIAGLCRAIAVAAAKHPLAAPLLLVLWPRLHRLARRFTALAARVAAGRRFAPVRRASPRPAAARRPRPPYRRLPRGFAWLLRLVPDATAAGSQLQHLLTTPEMAALIAAAPQAGRLLRPLCRTLGVRPPPTLLPPPRPARPTGPAAGRPEHKPGSAPRRTVARAPAPAVPPPRPPPAPRRRRPTACGPPAAA